jgi:hypothetical protein
MSLKALLALGLSDAEEWRDRLFQPPDLALYDAKKLAKTKLTVVLDIDEL